MKNGKDFLKKAPVYRAIRVFLIFLIPLFVGLKAWGWDGFLLMSPKNDPLSAKEAGQSESQAQSTQRIRNRFSPKRIDFNHIEGKGIGYSRGYTGLKAVTGKDYQNGHFLPLVELNGAIFDNGKFGANAGFIGRYLPKSSCTVFGFNLFYDFREGKLGGYNQVGGGLELLNKRWEMHINSYIPIGKKSHVRKCVYDDYIGPFRAVRRKYEFAANTFDATLGYYMVNSKNFQLYASGGAYCFFGQFATKAWGGKGVIRPQFGDYLSIELSVSHDPIFKTIYQANVIFTIPLYRYSSTLKNKRGPCGMSNRQIYQPINREIILLNECCWKANF